MATTPITGFKPQAGFGLLEVLVTVVILAVGLLALAQLQIVSLKASNNALLQSRATFMASSILDSMRANAEEAASYDVNMGKTKNGSSVASQDINAWQAELGATLPVGQGAVKTQNCGSDTALCQVAITIEWQIQDSEDNTGSLTIETNL